MARRRPTGRAQGKRVAARTSRFKSWAIGAAVVIALGTFAVFAFQAANRRTSEDPAVTALARANAGGDVTVLTGTRHTVYRSVAPLPSAAAPRADGRATLVWFSGTSCEFCEQMEPFAHQTANGFAARMVFVEKSVDDDRSAATRYAIRGTPTFVLIDAKGKELARFGFQPSASAFAQTIEAALKRAT
jgi:thiol-disulfide isomerase/thioredoxin